MRFLSIHTLKQLAWVLLIVMAVPTCVFAGVPLEVGLYKSTLLKLNKKMVLVTLANTRKDDKDKDVEIVAKSDKLDIEKRRDTGPSNTNKFVTVEILSPYDLKIDGITIGNTSMIVWSKGDGDEKPVPTFYDVKVTGDRNAIETQLKEVAPEVEVQYVNDTVILSGKAVSEQTKGKVEKIASAFSPRVLSYVSVSDPAQVLLEVKVAQVDKNSLKSLGMSWLLKGNSGEVFTNMVGAPSGGATASTTTSSTTGTSQQVGTGNGISANVAGLGSFNPLEGIQIGGAYFKGGVGVVLKALATKGYAKILAEPNLLVKSGQEGNFLAGSRIPYSIVTSAGGLAATTLVYETVGVKLKFKPEVLENGLINLKIDPAEVSSIAGTMAVNGYPIIDTRTVQTNVELKDGESLIMAGLLQEEQIKTMSKIPLLGDIPILGALFRSTQDDLKEKELVFFITPKVVKPFAKGEKHELPTDRKLSSEEERALQWMPLGQ